LLADIPGVQAPTEPGWAESNWQSYCVRLPAGADQQKVMQSMLDAGVATRRGIMCAHLEGAYAGFPLRAPLPESERARDGCVLLPLYAQMEDGAQDCVVAALRAALKAERSGGTAGQREPQRRVSTGGDATPLLEPALG